MSAPPPPPRDEGSLREEAERAALRPTNFPATERAAYVKDRIQEIRRLVALHKTDSEIRVALGSFADQYPMLFEQALRPNFNEQKLNLMIGLLERMGTGSMSQHQASVIVGEHLADTFIRPITGNDGLQGLPSRRR